MQNMKLIAKIVKILGGTKRAATTQSSEKNKVTENQRLHKADKKMFVTKSDCK